MSGKLSDIVMQHMRNRGSGSTWGQRTEASLNQGLSNAGEWLQGFVHNDPATKARSQKWASDPANIEQAIRDYGPYVPGIGEGVMVSTAANDMADAMQKGQGAGPGALSMAILGMMPGAGKFGKKASQLAHEAESGLPPGAVFAKPIDGAGGGGMDQILADFREKMATPDFQKKLADAGIDATGKAAEAPSVPLGIPQIIEPPKRRAERLLRSDQDALAREQWRADNPEPVANPELKLSDIISGAHGQVDRANSALDVLKPEATPEMLAPVKKANADLARLSRARPPMGPVSLALQGSVPGAMMGGIGGGLAGAGPDDRHTLIDGHHGGVAHDVPDGQMALDGAGVGTVAGAIGGMFLGKRNVAARTGLLASVKATADKAAAELSAKLESMPMTPDRIQHGIKALDGYASEIGNVIKQAESEVGGLMHSLGDAGKQTYETFLRALKVKQANAITRRDDLLAHFGAGAKPTQLPELAGNPAPAQTLLEPASRPSIAGLPLPENNSGSMPHSRGSPQIQPPPPGDISPYPNSSASERSLQPPVNPNEYIPPAGEQQVNPRDLVLGRPSLGQKKPQVSPYPNGLPADYQGSPTPNLPDGYIPPKPTPKALPFGQPQKKEALSSMIRELMNLEKNKDHVGPGMLNDHISRLSDGLSVSGNDPRIKSFLDEVYQRDILPTQKKLGRAMTPLEEGQLLMDLLKNSNKSKKSGERILLGLGGAVAGGAAMLAPDDAQAAPRKPRLSDIISQIGEHR